MWHDVVMSSRGEIWPDGAVCRCSLQAALAGTGKHRGVHGLEPANTATPWQTQVVERVTSRISAPPDPYEGLEGTEVGCQMLIGNIAIILSPSLCQALPTGHAPSISPFYRCGNRGPLRDCWCLELNPGWCSLSYHGLQKNDLRDKERWPQ